MNVPAEETLLQKIWRFILGLFGLDSAPPEGGTGPGGEPTPEPVMPPGKG
jgi:hypothetical protein